MSSESALVSLGKYELRGRAKRMGVADVIGTTTGELLFVARRGRLDEVYTGVYAVNTK